MNSNSEINARLADLRSRMAQAGVNAVIVPQTDAHHGEYLASHWQVRRWLSGFTGSAGDLVVTESDARLWADSRYWLQAGLQLKNTEIKVMEDGKPEVESIESYLLSVLNPGDTVGIDGMVFSIADTENLKNVLASKGIKLNTNYDPAAGWTDRPALPDDEIFVHDLKYAGESAQQKIQRVLENVNAQGADSVLISDLAEVAWLLNIRSSDVSYNPVVTSFVFVNPDGSGVLFVDQAKITDKVAAYLKEIGFETKPYESLTAEIANLSTGKKVLLSKAQSAGALLPLIGENAVVGVSPVAMLKAVKNDVQLDGVRKAMVRDGVAMVRSLIEIERITNAGLPLTETGVSDILLKHRKASNLFFDLSFGTIAGYGPNGAIVHYEPEEATAAAVKMGNLLLIDSGANYFDGTTDLTRTISIGEPTDAQRHDFTLVMKGHIAIATAIYPQGTRGAQLDVLARINLWKEGLSYLHGTGHGVGHFLNVHEGPQSIRLNDTLAPLTPGMITSNEPGLYREGEYGIRCENLVLTTEAFKTDFGQFYKFETLTLCPFDLRLFDTSIMTESEVQWLNNYHAMVCDRLLPHLDASEQEWLISKTTTLVK